MASAWVGRARNDRLLMKPSDELAAKLRQRRCTKTPDQSPAHRRSVTPYTVNLKQLVLHFDGRSDRDAATTQVMTESDGRRCCSTSSGAAVPVTTRRGCDCAVCVRTRIDVFDAHGHARDKVHVPDCPQMQVPAQARESSLRSGTVRPTRGAKGGPVAILTRALAAVALLLALRLGLRALRPLLTSALAKLRRRLWSPVLPAPALPPLRDK